MKKEKITTVAINTHNDNMHHMTTNTSPIDTHIPATEVRFVFSLDTFQDGVATEQEEETDLMCKFPQRTFFPAVPAVF